MDLYLGILIGIAISILIISTLAFFRRVIEHKTTIIEKQIDRVGPKPKGEIIYPKEEADAIREEIIEKNRREGKDTKVSDLL